MTDKQLPNATMAGAGMIDGGEYNAIRCSGSAKITGDIKCKSFAASGSISAEGNIECEGLFEASGSMKSQGDVKADTLKCSGASRICGVVEARKVNMAGAFHAEKDVSAETVDISGAVTVDGLLNAEYIDIRTGGQSRIGSIGGGTVTVKRAQSISFFGFFKKKKGILRTSVIESDSVDLEGTQAETVRTIDAKIRSGCEIGTLEYSGRLEMDSDAKVENIIKQ